MKTIAVIDDELFIGDMLEKALRQSGYDVLRAYSGTEALLLLKNQKPDLILLDLMLPGLSGEEVLSRIRGVPVIVVSAKAGVDDKVNLLMGGAVDYVTKPFEIKELLARIAIRFRGGVTAGDDAVLSFAEIELRQSSHSVTVNGREAHLTRTEYAILRLLMQNAGQVLTKSALLDRISLDTPDCTESSLKIHVSNLRGKLRDLSGKDYIEAIWGIGFKLRGEKTQTIP